MRFEAVSEWIWFSLPFALVAAALALVAVSR